MERKGTCPRSSQGKVADFVTSFRSSHSSPFHKQTPVCARHLARVPEGWYEPAVGSQWPSYKKVMEKLWGDPRPYLPPCTLFTTLMRLSAYPLLREIIHSIVLHAHKNTVVKGFAVQIASVLLHDLPSESSVEWHLWDSRRLLSTVGMETVSLTVATTVSLQMCCIPRCPGLMSSALPTHISTTA